MGLVRGRLLRGVARACAADQRYHQADNDGGEQKQRGPGAVIAVRTQRRKPVPEPPEVWGGHGYFTPGEFRYADMTLPASAVASPDPPRPAFFRKTAIAIGGVWPFFPA